MKAYVVLATGLVVSAPSATFAGTWENLVSATVAPSELSYKVLRQPVPDFLKQVARDAGVQIDLSSGVAGSLTALSVSGDVAAVLDAVAAQTNLQWFAFNGTFYVSTAGESEVRLLRLESVHGTTAISVLAEIGLTQERFPITLTGSGNTIALTGPPKLLALREAIIEGIVPPPAPKPVQAPKTIPPPPIQDQGITLFRNLSRSQVR